LAKGRIADMSLLVTLNGFVRVTHGSLDPHESALQTASRSIQLFLRSTSVWPTHT